MDFKLTNLIYLLVLDIFVTVCEKSAVSHTSLSMYIVYSYESHV